jgi:hypothetical protein
MSYRHTLEAAIESLHEIEQLVKGFPESGNIPFVEIDLTLQKIRNIYELMLLLKNQPEMHVPRDMPADTQTIKADKVQTPEPPPVDHVTAVKAKKEEKEIQILSDRFKGPPTLHESLHKTLHDKESGTLSQAKPVSSIRSAIGINDRFTFIRELFNNDAAGYERTIEVLDEASNFNEAYNYMIQEFDWDMDSEAVQLLLEIIRRRFITGRHE